MPALEFDFRVAVTLNQEPSRFEGRENKEIISIVAGLWSGSFGNGRITVLLAAGPSDVTADAG